MLPWLFLIVPTIRSWIFRFHFEFLSLLHMSIPLAPPSRMGPTTQQDAGSQPKVNTRRRIILIILTVLKVSLVFGGIGTACWCIQILPQIWKNWRRHTTTGVPGFMLLLWASGKNENAASMIRCKANTWSHAFLWCICNYSSKPNHLNDVNRG